MNQNILETNTNAFQKSPKSPKSSPLNTDTYYYNDNSKTSEIESSIDFILEHFEEPLYPRKISTYKSKQNRPFQFLVRSRQEIIDSFIDSNFVDCQISAYPSLIDFKNVPRYKPDFLFIDIDRNDPRFKTERSFQNVLYNTLKNIKEKLEGSPTVLETGGGISYLSTCLYPNCIRKYYWV